MTELTEKYNNCALCERRCGTDRKSGELGYCRAEGTPRVARAALHMWEEPLISGTHGSGTIFFSGCSLGCVYCQNARISRGAHGVPKTEEDLADIMLRLEERGAHNINFVTPTHYAPSVALAVDIAKVRGLSVPIVYNTGSYDTTRTLEMLGKRVDVYLPDLKYYRPETAKKLSLARDYVETARLAIDEMVRQQPTPIIKDGLMKKGVIVRILLLPGHLAEAKLNVRYLYEKYGNRIYISLMNQYTPMKGMTSPLDRRVTRAEYSELVDYAERIGVVNGFTQDSLSADESFIPDFDSYKI